jgi:uncharacterized cupin superfamily protein
MTIHIDAASVRADELDERELAPPSAQPLDGTVLCRSRVLFKADDARFVSGIWECDPGASRWEFDTRGEFIHVLSGRMTCQQDGSDPVEIGPGMTAVFPIGWRGVWTVHETLRKVYAVYK